VPKKAVAKVAKKPTRGVAVKAAPQKKASTVNGVPTKAGKPAKGKPVAAKPINSKIAESKSATAKPSTNGSRKPLLAANRLSPHVKSETNSTPSGKSRSVVGKSEAVRTSSGKPASFNLVVGPKPLAMKGAKPATSSVSTREGASLAGKPVKRLKKLKRRDDDEDAGPPKPLVPLPPPPVTTDSKPKKNQAGLSPRELEDFRSLLLLKRRELLGDMSSMEREALQSGQGSNLSNLPVHMADMGTDNYEQEFTLGLVEKDRQLLREINQALAKIQDGSYGICEGTAKPIPKARLEIQPWARHSVEWARQLEKNMMIRR